MGQVPMVIYSWPESAASIPINQSLLVIGVVTPPTILRAQARKRVRIALKQVLAAKLACPVAEIKLSMHAGQGLKLLQPKQTIGLSVSHESGLSLIAINMNGRVGVDLIDIKTIPNINEIDALANDYLGVKTAQHLFNLQPEQQSMAFAIAWTEFEAHLKYQEKNLSEYDSANILQTSNVIARQLTMPEGYIGTVVFSDSFYI